MRKLINLNIFIQRKLFYFLEIILINILINFINFFVFLINQ